MGSILSRAFDSAAGLPGDFCATCRGPSSSACETFILRPGQEQPLCPACGRETDADGRSALVPWEGRFLPLHVIVLERDPPSLAPPVEVDQEGS